MKKGKLKQQNRKIRKNARIFYRKSNLNQHLQKNDLREVYESIVLERSKNFKVLCPVPHLVHEVQKWSTFFLNVLSRLSFAHFKNE